VFELTTLTLLTAPPALTAVLREFTQLKQEPAAGMRRWFESDGLDLVVWFDDAGAIAGFQICYDFGRGEHALTWRRNEGCFHHAIDAGDSSPLKNETPILVPDGAVPWTELREAFRDRSPTLDPALRQLVSEKLGL
jgi:hypothetical protein